MAKVKIQGHASGTGVVTVTAPNTSTDRTITLPDATATIATTTDVAARLPSIVDGGNATAITIDSSENVGIGAAPAYLLDVHSAATSGTTVTANLSNAKYGVTTGYTALQIGTQYDDGSSRIVSRNNSGNQSELTLQPHASSSGVWTDALTLTSDGRGLSQFTAKVWVKINGNTPSFYDSHNASSITDNGVGQYQVNFSNNMSNYNYCAVAHAHAGGGTNDTNIFEMPDSGRATSNISGHMMSALNTATTFSQASDGLVDIVIFGD